MNRTAGAAQKSHGLSLDETAALWHIRLLDPQIPAEQRAEFERWLAASPLNKTAYDAAARAWRVAGDEAGDADIRAMREAALKFTAPPKHRLTSKLAAIAATVVAVVTLGLWAAFERPWSAADSAAAMRNVTRGQFETAVGERATIRLGDGSVVTLNTASHVQINLAGVNREVRLLAGQAIFEVAQDPARPFVVYAGDRKITALGTSFDVHIEKRELRVTLIDGKVAVDQLTNASVAESQALGKPAARARLEPGEQLLARLGGAATIQGANVERVVSWRDGRLVFEADRLADAIADMNRYSEQPLVLADPAIGELRLSGVFRTGQPAAFVHALEEYFPLESAEQAGAMVLYWRKSGNLD